MEQEPSVKRLIGILDVRCEIECLTGLRIGAAETSISIGGMDNPVIRDPLTNRPYIPGSSLKGKMRSLLERRLGKSQNWPISQIRIHVCMAPAEYDTCPICKVFGRPAPSQERWFCLTRLRVSDVFLTDESEERLRATPTDLPYTEVKTEAAIDRVTSAATPRSMERVPAGAVFGPARFSLLRYEGDAANLLDTLVEGFELLEADYLGGSGSRGSGRIAFRGISLDHLRLPEDGHTELRPYNEPFRDVRALREKLSAVKVWLEGA